MMIGCISVRQAVLCSSGRNTKRKEIERGGEVLFQRLYKIQARCGCANQNHPQIMEKKQALLAAAKENGDAKEIAKCEHGISNAECKYKTAIESSAKFGEILENYKKFADREILDTYKRKIVEPLGTIVVVEGPEVGQYWLYSEVEK